MILAIVSQSQGKIILYKNNKIKKKLSEQKITCQKIQEKFNCTNFFCSAYLDQR